MNKTRNSLVLSFRGVWRSLGLAVLVTTTVGASISAQTPSSDIVVDLCPVWTNKPNSMAELESMLKCVWGGQRKLEEFARMARENSSGRLRSLLRDYLKAHSGRGDVLADPWEGFTIGTAIAVRVHVEPVEVFLPILVPYLNDKHLCDRSVIVGLAFDQAPKEMSRAMLKLIQQDAKGLDYTFSEDNRPLENMLYKLECLFTRGECAETLDEAVVVVHRMRARALDHPRTRALLGECVRWLQVRKQKLSAEQLRCPTP